MSLRDALTAPTRLGTLWRARGDAEPHRTSTIVHLVPSVGWGGTERLACTLHRLCADRGWGSRVEAPPLDLLARGLWEDGGIERESPESTLAPAPEGIAGRARLLRAWALRTRERLEREGRPAVVHAHLAYPNRFGVALVASAGRPMIASFQLLPERGAVWSREDFLGVRSDRLLSWLAPGLARVTFVAPSEEDVARIRALVGRSARVERIANCAPLPRLHEPPAEPFAWGAGRVRLLSVGRLVAQKGFDRMIDALAHPSLAGLPWQWLLAGAGPDESALRARIEARGLRDRVVIDGGRRASALYPDAHWVLCPSRSEGFPLVPMEAAEAGVPAVLSRIAPHEERFGAVTEAMLPADEPAWPAALLRLLTNPEARARVAQAQRAAIPKDPRGAFADAYDALYRRAARWPGG